MSPASRLSLVGSQQLVLTSDIMLHNTCFVLLTLSVMLHNTSLELLTSIIKLQNNYLVLLSSSVALYHLGRVTPPLARSVIVLQGIVEIVFMAEKGGQGVPRRSLEFE